jgi:uncharacterized protein (DUF58 family)
MTRSELLQKITTFPLIASVLAEDLLSGDFRSIFRGQGIEADEVRRYEVGDDIRSIDWNVSARFGTPYVKMYREERELSVFLVMDCSPSMYCGSVINRAEQAILAGALLAFSTEHAGQRLGAVFFDTEIIKVFPAEKGMSHSLAMINAALDIRTHRKDGKKGKDEKEKSSNLGAALSGLSRILKRRSIIIVISDFFCMNWEQELGKLCQKHDVIAIRITDTLDTNLFKAGLITMEDPETNARLYAPTGFAVFRTAWKDWHKDRSVSWKAIMRRAGAASLELSTADDAVSVLVHFFRGRRKV